MFRHVRDDIHFVYFEGQFIILDILSDSYSVLSPKQTHDLHLLATQPSHSTLFRNPLLGGNKLFKEELFTNPDERLSLNTTTYTGVPVNCWQLHPNSINKTKSIRLLISFIFILRTVHRCSKTHRLAGLLRMLNKKLTYNKKINIKKPCVDELISTLNMACLLYKKKTKCLEWACALILIGARYQYDMTLVIGVQNRPFYAHAWVEFAGQVIGDDPERRRQLAIIYPSNEQVNSI